MRHSSLLQFEYHHWANKRIFERLDEVPDEVFSQEITSVFSSIQEVMGHMYQAEGMWLSVISGNEFSETMKILVDLKEKSTGANPKELQLLFDDLNKQFTAFLNDQENLDKEITIHHPKLGELTSPISELVRHVVNHGTYHRGNITAMLRQQGHKGASTDYIFYLYEQQS